jgi:hypothetical protein
MGSRFHAYQHKVELDPAGSSCYPSARLTLSGGASCQHTTKACSSCPSARRWPARNRVRLFVRFYNLLVGSRTATRWRGARLGQGSVISAARACYPLPASMVRRRISCCVASQTNDKLATTGALAPRGRLRIGAARLLARVAPGSAAVRVAAFVYRRIEVGYDPHTYEENQTICRSTKHLLGRSRHIRGRDRLKRGNLGEAPRGHPASPEPPTA